MNPRRRRHQRIRRNYRKLFARKVAEGYFRRGVAIHFVATAESVVLNENGYVKEWISTPGGSSW